MPNDRAIVLEVRHALAAGASARDRDKALAHIARMAAQGVKPPPHVPMLYPLMPTLVTNASDVGVIGDDSTPEIEPVLFHVGGVDYVTVGSDHTDRRIEARSALQGKNSCPKIVAAAAWPLEQVRDHWDELTLQSRCSGQVLQEGRLSHLLPWDELLAFVDAQDGVNREGRLVFCGTVPTLKTPSARNAHIELTLHDPIGGASLQHRYRVHVRQPYFVTDSAPTAS